jgi:hypothetical protein
LHCCEEFVYLQMKFVSIFGASVPISHVFHQLGDPGRLVIR